MHLTWLLLALCSCGMRNNNRGEVKAWQHWKEFWISGWLNGLQLVIAVNFCESHTSGTVYPPCFCICLLGPITHHKFKTLHWNIAARIFVVSYRSRKCFYVKNYSMKFTTQKFSDLQYSTRWHLHQYPVIPLGDLAASTSVMYPQCYLVSTWTQLFCMLFWSCPTLSCDYWLASFH